MNADAFLAYMAIGIAGTLFGVFLTGCVLVHPLRHRAPRRPRQCCCDHLDAGTAGSEFDFPETERACP